MQYVGQTGRALKKRFGEHYRRMNKPKKIDNFLYRHFKRKGHTPANILVQPVEKLHMMQIQQVDLKLSKDTKPN